MEFFQLVLPVYVDYLGAFEEGLEDIHEPVDVVQELNLHGVQHSRYLPGGELVIEEDQLVLRDSPQRIVAERYDLRDIENPVAFVKKSIPDDPKGLTRLVVFRESKKGHFNSKARFHAVQCVESDPKELVEMIKSARSRYISETVSRKSSANSLDSNWIISGGGGRNSTLNLRHQSGTDSVRSATIRRNGAPSRGSIPFRGKESVDKGGIPVLSPVPPGNTKEKLQKKPSIPLVTDQTAGALGFERPSFQFSISEDPVQKDTILLNYCIDDIERFAAEIRRKHFPEEINDRRKSSEPRAIDFVNIFQKFKLAFNLLGRLEEFMENPNAPEMLHHLFPPLAFLVDECFDVFDEDLVKDVLYPLPTPKAVDLLERCLGQREAVIWRALGENWLNPNVRQPHETVPYSPRFQDGWSPGVINFTFMDHQSGSNSKRSSTISVAKHSVSSDEMVNEFDAYRDELMGMGSKIGLVTIPRDAQNVKELSVNKGEYLEIVNDNKNWWRCINSNGQAGFVPCNFMKVIYYQDGEIYQNEGKLRKKLSSKKIRKMSSPRKQEVYSDQENSSSSSLDLPRGSAPPPAGAAPPAPPPMPTFKMDLAPTIIKPVKREHSVPSSSIRSSRSMQDELRSVLDLINAEEEEDTMLEIKTTPDVYITQASSPNEVKQWLKDKGFSQRAVQQLSRLNGNQLFAMSRRDLIAAFGKAEGIRLDSQITISRNSAGFQTAKTSELRDILAKARRRTDENVKKEFDTSNA